MRQDQLEQARQARWRQDGNALLTLDDAERWLADTPLCLYLPRRQHLPVPAPSFVEAVAGRADATPNPEQIAAAAQMLARLVASGAVIALNLFGAAPGIGVSSFVGEHPDFLATPEALPYLYALQPERNPKREPSTAGNGRVSPLAAEAWKLLEREGALTTGELRSQLGREVTEAAVLRSLAELWHTMRVVPIPAENPQEGAHWELLSARHRRELTIGSTQSQTTALSILVSFYLQSAVAATAEEAGIFLSPVASRSRIRDVIHGLSTTRQLASFGLAGDEQFYVEGTLPEIAEEEETVVLAAAAIGEDAGLEQNEPDLTEAAAANPAAISQERPAAPRRSPRPAFGERARGSFAARDRRTPPSDRRGPSHDRPPRREGGFRRPQRSDASQRGSFRRIEGTPEGAEGTSPPPRPNFERRARPSFARGAERPERPARPGGFVRRDRPGPLDGGGASRGGRPAGSFDRGRPPRPGGSSFRPKKSFPEKSFPGKPFGDRPPRPGVRSGVQSGEGAERPRFRPGAGSGSPRFGAGRPSRPPRDGERPQRSFGGGEGRPFRKPQGDRPAGGPRRFDGRSGSGARPGGPARPARPGGFSRPPRRDGESRPPFGRGESRPPFRAGQSRPQSDRPFKRPYAPAGDRPPRRESAGGYVKPGYGRPGGGDRPERKFTPRPRPESRPEGRPEGTSPAARSEGGARESHPFRPAGQRPGRPGGFGKPPSRSGGSFRKPGFGKPSFGRPSSGKPGGYRKAAGDRPAAGGDRPAPGGDRPDRPRSPRPAFASGERPPRPAAGRDAASGPRKPGGFSKPGGPGKSFGKPRPAGAGSRGPRPAGAGKGRTSTTTSSGKPRRPGGFDKPGAGGKPGASSRPPAKGSFGDFKPRGKSAGAKRPATKRPDAKRPGGFAAPKRKPRSEGDKG